MTDGEIIKIVDPKEYKDQKQDERSFRAILMDYVRVIGKLSKVEFRGGYWMTKTKTLPGGVILEENIYIPDTREEYCNAIDWLHDILLPYFDDDDLEGSKEMKSSALEVNHKLDKIRDTFLEESQQDEILDSDSYEDKKSKTSLEVYKFKKLKLHRIMFQEINKFLKKNNYFDDIAGYEE